MADIITITGPNGLIQAMLAAYGEGHQTTIEDPITGLPIPNPQTKSQYAQAKLTSDIAGRIQYYQQRLKDQEAQQIPKLVLTFSGQPGV